MKNLTGGMLQQQLLYWNSIYSIIRQAVMKSIGYWVNITKPTHQAAIFYFLWTITAVLWMNIRKAAV